MGLIDNAKAQIVVRKGTAAEMQLAGEADRAMPPAVVRRQFHVHRASLARTELRTFPGRTHWLIAQDGWEEVAQACNDWIGSLHAIQSLVRLDERASAW